MYDQNNRDVLPKHKVIFYAAHYPTILGLFAVFDMFETNKVALSMTSVPNYASAFIIEVWKKSGELSAMENYYVKIKFKDGDRVKLSNAPYLTLSEDCTVSTCTMSSFKKALEGKTLSKLKWCSECGNTAAQDCFGAPKKVSRNGLFAMIEDLSGGAGIAIGFFVGILITVITAFLVQKLRNRKKYTLHNNSNDGEAKQEMVNFNAVAEL